MKKITFLLDKNNNWIEKYVLNFIDLYDKSNYLAQISYLHEDCIDNEIVFILGYTKILNETFFRNNKLSIVVHESDLPFGKGFSPIQWQILENKKNIVFTLFEANEKIDSGDILLQKNVRFSGYELFDEIRDIQGKATIEMIAQFLSIYPKYVRKKQVGEETIFKRRTEESDQLNINKTILDQFNHFRIANNLKYPVWFEIDGHKYELKIFER